MKYDEEKLWDIEVGHSTEFPWQWGIRGIKKRIKEQHKKSKRRYAIVRTVIGYHNLIRRIK